MKSIEYYIKESLSNEISSLRKKISKMDKTKIFDGNYNLDDSLDKDFYDILVSLNSPKASDKALIDTWKMLFSKLIIEPLVGELIGEDNCEYSSVDVDRKEKWDIKYKNIFIDVKATYNDRTSKFSFPKKDADYIINYNKPDLEKRYVLFFYPEIKTWDDAVRIYKNKSSVDMKMISYSDFKEMLNDDVFEDKGQFILISSDFIEKSDKFRKFKK